MFYLDKRESPEPLAVTAEVGDRKPAQCTALGRALLAFLSPEQLDTYLCVLALPAATVNSITDPGSGRPAEGRDRKGGS
ncbi:MAG: IclR family transcriptional regulator C-terminal domain-containing protein [Bacillota bacterium]